MAKTQQAQDIEGSRKAPVAPAPRPQLPTLIGKPPAGDDWLHEIKFDGYRLIARIERQQVNMITRNGHDWTHRFPTIVEAIRMLELDDAILDGEVIALEADGRSGFGKLQDALSRGRTGTLVYQAFDLMHLDQLDLTGTPLITRKEMLKEVLGPNAAEPEAKVRYTDHIIGQGPAFYAQACQMELEGIISKHVDAPYEQRRSKRWYKCKCTGHDEFIVIGFTQPANSRVGFGSLVLGAYDETGTLRYEGRVGTGFSNRQLQEIYALLEPRVLERKPITGAGPCSLG